MNSLLMTALSNVIVAGGLALLVYAISRVCRRPALIHSLWLLVLLKLITPPVLTVPVEIPGIEIPQPEPAQVVRPAAVRSKDASPTARRLVQRQQQAAPTADDTGGLGELPIQRVSGLRPLPARKTGNERPLAPEAGTATETSNKNGGSTVLPNPMKPMQTPRSGGRMDSPGSIRRTVSQQTPQLPSAGARDDRTASAPGRHIARSEAADSKNVASRVSVASAGAEWPFTFVPWAVAIWLSGSAFLAILNLIRIIYFRHIVKAAEGASPELLREVGELAATIGMSRSPQVLLLPGAVSPMLWAGGRKPVLLFPRELLGRTDIRTRATLLMHELAHMRRGDHWVRFLELVTCCLYWWNPVVWWARREIHRVEEECCDAWVVEHSVDGGRVYANAILDTIDFLADARPAVPPIASGISHVKFIRQRLTRILQGAVGGRLTRSGRFAVVLFALCVLPLLPTLGQQKSNPSASEEPTAAVQSTATKKTDNAKETVARSSALTSNIGGAEPTRFETSSRTLQFDPLEVRSLDVSPDGILLVSGHGRWTTDGAVRVWNLKTKKEVAAFFHSRGVSSVKFSPDGKLLATASWDRILRIRDTKTFQLLHEIPLDSVARLAFSPDSKMLASATESGKLQLWDPKTGKEKQALPGTFFRLQFVAFSPNGRYIAVGGGKFDNPRNGRISAWDLETRKQLGVVENLSAPVIGVAFSPDGKTLIAGGFEMQVKAWNLPDLRLKWASRGHTQYIESVLFSPDGRRVISVGYDESIRFWDARTGETVQVLRAHPGGALSSAISADGKTLFTGGIDKTIRIWDLATYRQLDSLQPGADSAEIPEPVLAVAHAPVGSLMASAHEDGTVRLRDTTTGKVLRVLRGHDDVVANMVFSSDGTLLATASYDNSIKLWNTADGTVVATLNGHTNWVFAVAFSPDGKQLASSGYDKTIRLWDVASRRELAVLKGHTATVRSVAFSPDGLQLVSGSGDRSLKLWDLKTQKEIRTFRGHKGTVRAVAFSPDGSIIASASEDRTVKIWDPQTGQEKQTLSGHSGMVWCLAFSPRGGSLVTGGFDNAIIVWDPSSGQQRQKLSGHRDVVTSLAFTPDMKGLISGSYDKSIRFWKSQAPPVSELLTIAVSPQATRTVAFSPNGRFLAAAGHDQLVKIWDLKTGRLLHVLRGHTGGIRNVRFSRDSRKLVSGAWDRTIQVWDVLSGRSIIRMNHRDIGHDIGAVDFSRDGGKVVSGGIDGTVRQWDIATGKQIWTTPKMPLPVISIDVSPDGRTVVTATGDYKRPTVAGEVRVWDMESGRELFKLAGIKGNISDVKFSPDGRFIAATEGDRNAPFKMWDVKTRQRVALSIPRDLKARFTFLPNSHTIAIGRYNIVLYDLDANRKLATYAGHPDGSIFQLAASPDGSVIASASHDGTVRLWPTRRTPPLKPRWNVKAHEASVRFAVVTKDGRRIISGAQDRIVTVWDRETGKQLKSVQTIRLGGIRSGALSPDGTLLAIGAGFEKTVHFRNAKTLEKTGPVLKHDGNVYGICFSADGKQIVTGGGRRVRLWDVQTGKLLREFPEQEKSITAVAVSPDGRTVAAGTGTDGNRQSEPGVVKLWDLKTGRELATHREPRAYVKSVRFTRDGRRLIAACNNGQTFFWNNSGRANMASLTMNGYRTAVIDDRLLATTSYVHGLVLWDMQRNTMLTSGRKHKKYVTVLNFDSNLQEFVTAGSDGTLAVWPMPSEEASLAGDVLHWKAPRTLPAVVRTGERSTGGRTLFGVTSPDFQFIATGQESGDVVLYRVGADFQEPKRLAGHAGTVLDAAFSPNSRWLASAGDDMTVRLWDVQTGVGYVLKGHEKRVNSVVFTPDGKRIVSADGLGFIKIWNVSDRKLIATLRKKESAITRLAISPDGHVLAVGGWAKDIDLWRLDDRKLLSTLSGHKERVLSLAFSPDGKTLVSGDAGRDTTGVIKVWNVATRTLQASLNVKTTHVLAAAFSPDGRTFVTSGGDTSLRFWDRATGQLLATIPSGHRIDVRSIQWSPDGSRLLTTSLRGVVKSWSTSSNGRLWMPGFTTVVSAVRFQRERTVATHPGGAFFATYSSDGKLLATGGANRQVQLWNTRTWQPSVPPIRHDAWVLYGAFSPDGKVLSTSTIAGNVYLTSTETGKRLHTLSGHKDIVRKVAFSPDGKLLISGSADETVRVWHVESGKLLRTIDVGSYIWSVRISPNGKTIAVGTGDPQNKGIGGVSLWNIQTGERVKTPINVKGDITTLQWLTDSKLLIARGGVGLGVYDRNSGKRLSVLHWPVDVRLARVTPDKKFVVVAHGDAKNGRVAVYNLETGAAVSVFRVSDSYLFGAELSNDGSRIATASKDGHIVLWRRAERDAQSAGR